MNIKNCLSLLLAGSFFLAAFITLSDYNISWDETLHFRRGQAYLHYFLTGQTTYGDLPQIDLQGTGGNPKNINPPRRSFYQNDFHNGEFMLKKDSGHPPINDELSALSNYIFFQRLGILDDISAHHLFNIAASTLLVFVVFVFAKETFGNFGAVISYLSLITYPLFWSESHFNIKDPPEAAFFASTIWMFWKSLNTKNLWWLFGSIIAFSLGLGTKFNILFLPFIIIPYLFIRYWKKIQHYRFYIVFKIPKRYLTLIVLSPILISLIFFGTWPYLWQIFPDNLLKIFGFYKDIGIGTRYQPDSFFIFGFNTYPIQWIFYTTPPLVLLLSTIGIIFGYKAKLVRKDVYFLLLLWLVVPIMRVTFPGTVIYGGIRQIFEFIPAMVLFSGLGAVIILNYLTEYIKFANIAKFLLILYFLYPTYILFKLHPNENVYFNSFIGGLKGAEQRNFPSWGNSFGNAYLKGIQWLNKNAPYDAKLALIQGTPANAPAILLRKDIDYKNANWSGIERGGEYLMELTFNDTTKDFNYAWDYVDKFLKPVYELRVENVPILKIWKNDLEHTNVRWSGMEIPYEGKIEKIIEVKDVLLKFENRVFLSRLKVNFIDGNGCSMPKASYLETSLDGNNWIREQDPIPFPQTKHIENVNNNELVYFLAGKEVKFLRLIPDENSCLFNFTNVNALILH